jgi:hypothetical protein
MQYEQRKLQRSVTEMRKSRTVRPSESTRTGAGRTRMGKSYCGAGRARSA